MATHVDIGKPFEKNTFGSCAKLNNNPCQMVVTEWSGFYKKITIADNNGHALLEDSKGNCPIGDPDCITIINHGQTAEPTKKNVDNADNEVLAELIPFVDLGKEDMDLLNIKNL